MVPSPDKFMSSTNGYKSIKEEGCGRSTVSVKFSYFFIIIILFLIIYYYYYTMTSI
jgi:hypothetical protein